MSVLAIVPARSGSKGIPGKNFRELGGKPLFEHAIRVGLAAGCEVVVSSDSSEWEFEGEDLENAFGWIPRPAHLAQDDTPMVAVVQHVLEQVPGPDDQVIVLLQPTQPFRTPAHVRTAIKMLQDNEDANSVASIVELPVTHSPDYHCHIMDGQLYAIHYSESGFSCYSIADQPTRRQDAVMVFRRDGTVYAFRRRTVSTYQNIYGRLVLPLIIPPEESCELDTEADWQAVERRWRERHGPA